MSIVAYLLFALVQVSPAGARPVAAAAGDGAGLERARHSGRGAVHTPVSALLAVAHYLVTLLALFGQLHLNKHPNDSFLHRWR